MKLISWNVNGLRACREKGFEDFFLGVDADAVCLQETKLQAGQIELDTPGYSQSWNYAEKKGYSGTAVFSKTEPLSVCGDLNVAHREIDLKNPSTNHNNPGFTDEERGCFSRLLESGFTDSFRYLYPELEGAYSWWSYRMRARERGVGWRIDYFLVSDRLRDNISKAFICSEIYGSDHCPVGLELLW